MEQSKIDRINELAKKKKSGVALTDEENAEREILHKEYIAEYRTRLSGILDKTVIQYPDGSKEPLKKKSK